MIPSTALQCVCGLLVVVVCSSAAHPSRTPRAIDGDVARAANRSAGGGGGAGHSIFGPTCLLEYVEDFSGGDVECGCGFDPIFHHTGSSFVVTCNPTCVLNMANARAGDVVTWTLPEPGYQVIQASAQMADNCGMGCTTITFHGVHGSFTFASPGPTGGEFLTFSTNGLGLGVITAIELHSAEGFFDNLKIIAAPIDVLLGDINDDDRVDGADLGQVLGAWGECGDCSGCPADLNCDCTVDAADLGTLLGNWMG